MKNEIITLSGFGELDGEGAREQLEEAAKLHNLKFYPTYYDHELKGKAKDIEALTLDLWGMPRDQWAENALIENRIES